MDTYIITFSTSEPLPEIKIGYTVSKIKVYIPNLLRYFNC